MNARNTRYTLAGVVIAVALWAAYYLLERSPAVAASALPAYIMTNEEFIDGLYTNIDITDPKEVFDFVFKQLDDEVMIYPSENYYYFKFAARGKTFNGSITFYPEDRDSGIVGFGYVGKVEDKFRQKDIPVPGGDHDFTKADGMELKKIDDFNYEVTYKEKSVLFKLFSGPITSPAPERLRSDEIVVGPSFDESGLRFHLLFNKAVRRLYWMLDESGFTPESFRDLSPNVVIGDRTSFAFYRDTLRNRKILVGVDGFNVLQNNWYDGPFDQMPDNFVVTGQVRVKEYLLAHYSMTDDMIDEHGCFAGPGGARLPVATYRVYFSADELRFVDSCAVKDNSSPNFYAAITEQVFYTPAHLEY